MTAHYHDPNDVLQLKAMKAAAPQEYAAWLGLEKLIGRQDGALPQKYRELIAVAVALSTQCPYCIEAHVKAAKKAGASAEELAETSFIAAALRAGAASLHGAMAMKFYNDSPAPQP
ncbi:alkylhydroperoxidase AhpD family core domain-containing protein [Solimonas aquatica]|uniref:Alkylhydroperoxidase AhpD family core domain-containing protein n=1 Tax=Solimonas aquatica TaxID=489703 RepID=A0A1H9GUD4_9GAMM|nr:carboxymuconolactone decarboxylase family protein [Solimonas aquatica]SEQ53671.1 alkylhydroperoxidase AhpD family core domain-containing protein [Solimonas aquatica]